MANLGDTLFTSSLRDILVLKSIVMTWVGPVLHSPSAYSRDYVTGRSHEISGQDVETGLQNMAADKTVRKNTLAGEDGESDSFHASENSLEERTTLTAIGKVSF